MEQSRNLQQGICARDDAHGRHPPVAVNGWQCGSPPYGDQIVGTSNVHINAFRIVPLLAPTAVSRYQQLAAALSGWVVLSAFLL